MGSCCRGRRRVNNSGAQAECKSLEDGGAGTTVQVLSTAQGSQLVVATPRNGYLDLGSFLTAYKCNGSTANLLRRYLPTIQQALQLDPVAFSAHRSGIRVTELIRLSEKIMK